MGNAGVNIPSQLLQIFASASEAIIYGENPTVGNISFGPWTPPQYSKPAVTILSVPATTSNTQGTPQSAQVDYVFDAVFKLLHRRVLHKTSHPVLTGANISDHAYLEPTRVTLEIGMSDAMNSFSNGIWVGASTKSISAWQIIKSFQTSKQLLTLTSRLDTYLNMMVVDATAPDDYRTRNSLKCTIVLEELIAASVYSAGAQSSLPQTTDTTYIGTVQSVEPNTSQAEQYSFPTDQYPDLGDTSAGGAPLYPQVPGAGNVGGQNWSKYQVITGTFEGNEGTPP